MKAATFRNLTIAVQILLCALAVWIMLDLHQQQRTRNHQSSTLHALLANLASSQMTLSEQHDSIDALLAQLRNAQQRFIQHISLLEYGDHTGIPAAITGKWKIPVQQIGLAGKHAFASINELNTALDLHKREAARRVAHQRQLTALSNNLTRLFASELSVDLDITQLRQIYLIHYHLQALIENLQDKTNMATDNEARQHSDTTLASFDALLQGENKIANLALRRHLANLRLRCSEQLNAIDTHSTEIAQNKEPSGRQAIDLAQQKMLADLSTLHTQANQLTKDYHADDHIRLLGYGALMLGVLIAIGCLPWLTHWRARSTQSHH